MITNPYLLLRRIDEIYVFHVWMIQLYRQIGFIPVSLKFVVFKILTRDFNACGVNVLFLVLF